MTLIVKPNRDPDELRPPSFGLLLRKLRDARGVSRERLAFNAGVSASYISHLEKGDRGHPTREVVDALLRYLDRIDPLSTVERRHLLDLAGLGTSEFPTVEQLRDEITDDMRRALDLHEPNLAAYVDTRWNVLACNASYSRAFPGLEEDVNILRWLLGNPAAREVMLDWEEEVRLTIHWLRGLIAGSGDTAWSADYLSELGRFGLFREMWDEGIAAYGRPRATMHLHDTISGRCRAIAVQMFSVFCAAYPNQIQIFLGIPSWCSEDGEPLDPGHLRDAAQDE
ncbi:helix-turn-helix transcriptional regulator [Nocardia huaxiensis]|uniref:Helix-turn-helix domain-containing protein n=1 Tax=Nocardia huaxiensis TaxID=2755382 RepID=A0A7D6VDR2_9NOCA|nr:helix-turn-helix transcriptional regulator [Nocardia huaxiensis]QLY32994.1 helix-turn-helix domain-containing protein [Nocardia huaxiensis]UFS93245.1 helix-turn-helix transcriptional regulator [Nocardia huaxiensis]